MISALKNILVPVDFSVNTEVAVAKAVALLDREEAKIHLLHVCSTYPFCSMPEQEERCLQKLAEWKDSIEQCTEGITVHCQLKKAFSVQKAICQTAKEQQVDMIVIGQSAIHSGFPLFWTVSPMNLKKATGIPVLTVKPGSLRNKTKTVVMPVSDTFPETKIQALKVLCRNVKLNIHLITMLGDRSTPSEFSASALLQTYQWLKTRLHCPVEFAVVHGSNKAKAILRYAEEMHADVLLVQPETETRIGWWNTHISDVLPRGSKMQVLAVG